MEKKEGRSIVEIQLNKIQNEAKKRNFTEGLDKLEKLEVDENMPISTLLWDGENRNIIDEMIEEKSLGDNVKRLVMRSLDRLSKAMIDGDYVLGEKSIRAGVVGNLSSFELKRMGLNYEDIEIANRLFPKAE